MLSTRDLKRKIKSVGNTEQITRAMEMVAAARMRRSQLIALGSRPFCQKALELLGNLSRYMPQANSKNGKTALLVVTSDKGLCGGFNANVLKKSQVKDADIIAVGKKGRDFFLNRGYRLIGEFSGIGDVVKLEEVYPIADLLIDLYNKAKYSFVMASYTNFFSTLRQEAVLRQILPVNLETVKEIIANIVPEKGRYAELRQGKESKSDYLYDYEYKFEPSAEEVLDRLLHHLVQLEIYHIILESNASEHSARMVAMRNASENAENLIKDLTLNLNKFRQSAITQELLEISSGSAS